MKRVITSIAAAVRRVAEPFLPAPGTTEGAVYLGMALLAIGFWAAGLVPLMFLVPGAVLTVAGLIPAFHNLRRGA